MYNTFDHRTSSFAAWEIDTQAKLEACVKHDLKHIHIPKWDTEKVPRYELDDVKSFVKENFSKLKYLYLVCLSESKSHLGIDLESLQKFMKIEGCQELF